MKKRLIYRVLPWTGGRWAITRNRKHWAIAMTKATAMSIARTMARAHHDRGELTQVVIHKKSGKIQIEYTYGADPKRRKG